MKQLIKAAGLSLVVLTSTFAAGAAEAAQKVGYINTAKVFQALPQREVVLQQLKDEFKDKSAELQAIQAKAKTKIEKLQRDGQLMSQEDIDNLKLEIGQLDNKFKLKAQSFEQAKQRRQAEEEQKLFKVIQDSVDKVAKEGNYDIILEAQALRFANPEYDISEKVINSLK